MVYIKYFLVGDFVYGGCLWLLKGLSDEFVNIFWGFNC